MLKSAKYIFFPQMANCKARMLKPISPSNVQSKEEGKDQESTQSNTSPDQKHHMESDRIQENITYKRYVYTLTIAYIFDYVVTVSTKVK